MDGVESLMLLLATYLIIAAKATAAIAKSEATIPIQVGYNVSTSVWYTKWSHYLNEGSRLVFSYCNGSEISSFAIQTKCETAEFTGITPLGKVLLHAELYDPSTKFVEISKFAVSINFDVTESVPSLSEVELTPRGCFQSQLFSGSISCYTNLQASILLDGVGNHFNVFSPSLPKFMSYELSADNETLSLCLRDNVLSQMDNISSSTLTIQEMCVQQAPHICENEDDDQSIVYFGKRGTLHKNTDAPIVNRCIFSTSEVSTAPSSPTQLFTTTPTSDLPTQLSTSSPTDAKLTEDNLELYIRLGIGGTVLLSLLVALFLLTACIVKMHRKSEVLMNRPPSVTYKNSVNLNTLEYSRTAQV